MSGFKRAMVTISEEEYRKLTDVNKKEIKSAKSVKKEKTEIVVDNSIQIQAALEQIQQRELSVNKFLNQFGLSTAEDREDIQTDLHDFREYFEKRLFEQTIIAKENLQSISEFLEIHHQMEAENNQLRDQLIDKLQIQIQHNAQKITEKSESSINWIINNNKFVDYLFTQYDIKRFEVACWNEISPRLNFATLNHQNGNYEASISQSQEVFIKLNELQTNLEIKTIRWQSLYNTAWLIINQLYQDLKSSQFCQAIDLNGISLPIDLRINFWTNGKFAELINLTKKLILDIRENINIISIVDLESILSVNIPEIEQSFEDLIFQTRFAAISSQIRINIADMAIQALMTQGYFVSGYGYHLDDMRSPYQVNMRHVDGSEVVVKVFPDDLTLLSNDIIIESLDITNKTERELRLRSTEVLSTLRQFGLQIGSIDTNPNNFPGLTEQSSTKQTEIKHGHKHIHNKHPNNRIEKIEAINVQPAKEPIQ